MSAELNLKAYQDIMSRWYRDFMKAVETAAKDYAKEQTLDNADRLYQAVYGMLPTGDRTEGEERV